MIKSSIFNGIRNEDLPQEASDNTKNRIYITKGSFDRFINNQSDLKFSSLNLDANFYSKINPQTDILRTYLKTLIGRQDIGILLSSKQ